MTKVKAEHLSADRDRRRKKKEGLDVKKRYDAALERIEHLEEDLEAALKLQEESPTFKIEARQKTGSEATAVALLSDWHCEEVCDPKTINGLNRYNPEIAQKRAVECFQKIVRLVEKEKQDCSIDNLLLWFGGDFITNSLRDENLESNALRPIEAALYAKGLLHNGLIFLQNHLPKVKIRVACSSGNHARITKKIHIATEHGNSLETFIYCALRSEHPEIEWDIDPSYHTLVELYGKTLRFNHGHFVKYGGGIGGLTIPMLKALNGWDTSRRADLTCIGHYHQFLSHRRFVVNGSMVGYNAFAMSIKAEFEPPSQTFFVFDKRYGRSVTIPIYFSV